ncbi:phosphate ABC transporter substrate-binding protein PstS [Kitasatospora sp. NBC_00458]|uniref:phosphate ABC transporter substrate-binding protein PstS n=1 Tax=Kitasatospora sp. NBC_00458 TaxID=2903568 RepID=UPI002E18EDFE
MSTGRSVVIRSLTPSALALVVAVAASGCGMESDTAAGAAPTSAPTSGASSARASASIACDGSGQLLGAGSTAQGNAIDLWRNEFESACPSVTVNYGGGGSGAGVQQFNSGKVAFAGTDAALSPAEVDASKQVCTGGRGIDLPMVGGLISVVFNVTGVDRLVLDGPTTAKIFDSQITTWNDPAIVALNPGTSLPDAPIQAFHRGDDSGTTANLTAYLAAASNGAWGHPAGKAWAGKGGQSANGSAGVAAQVKQVDNSIGYAELSFAQTNNLKSAAISTGAAQPVEANAANAAATLATAQVTGTDGDLALNLDYAIKDENAYPLVLVTYEVVCDKGNKASALPALKSFLSYTSSDAGQQAIAPIGYVPLPEALTSKVRTAVSGLA